MRVREISFFSAVLFASLMLHIIVAYGTTGERQTIRQLRYPDYDEQGRLNFELIGDEATIREDGLIEIVSFNLNFYEDGKVVMNVTSPSCLFDREQHTAVSTSTVVIARSEMVLTGKGFTWHGKTGGFKIHNDARLVFNLKSTPSDEEKRP